MTMIKSFRGKWAEAVFLRLDCQGFPEAIQRRAYRKLVIIDSAASLEDLRSPPGNRLERLAGDRDGQHSIRINDRWRICFAWQDGDAFDVEIVDYH